MKNYLSDLLFFLAIEMDLARDSYVFSSAQRDITKSCIYIFFNYKQVKFTFLFLFLLSSAIGLNGNGAT